MAVQTAGEVLESELQRMDVLLAAERLGTPLTQREATAVRCSGPLKDALPLQNWIRMLLNEHRSQGSAKAKAIVVKRLQTTTRRFDSYMEARTVYEGVVDRLTRAEGRYTIHDLYGPGSVFGAERGGTTFTPRLVRNDCVSPACDERRASGSHFCDSHRDLFRRLREELEQEANHFKTRIRRQGARPSCTTPGCVEPRTPPSAFCLACQSEGAQETAE